MKLDFHSHILPGLDDGAISIEDSLMLAKAMKDWGFERVTCTPHITNLHPNTPDTIRPAFEQLQEAMAVAGIDPMEVLRGAKEAQQEYDLRSFENPVWLYTATRNLLYRNGKALGSIVAPESKARIEQFIDESLA